METQTARTDFIASAHKLSTTIDQLTNVLEEEISGVYTRKTAELARLYQDKTRLLADYAAGIGTLRSVDGKEGFELPADLSASIRQKSSTLMQAMERNVKALRVAHEASRQVVDVIIDAVKKQRQTGAAYSVDRNGGLLVNEGSDSAAAAITLDTRL